MHDIDFIKKCCEYADGFEVLNYPKCTHIRVPFEREHTIDIKNAPHLFKNNKHLDGYLLQRAIEGVNKYDNFDIEQNRSNIAVVNLKSGWISGWELDPDDPETAKRSALEYIFEQEKKNERN